METSTISTTTRTGCKGAGRQRAVEQTSKQTKRHGNRTQACSEEAAVVTAVEGNKGKGVTSSTGAFRKPN